MEREKPCGNHVMTGCMETIKRGDALCNTCIAHRKSMSKDKGSEELRIIKLQLEREIDRLRTENSSLIEIRSKYEDLLKENVELKTALNKVEIEKIKQEISASQQGIELNVLKLENERLKRG